MHSSALHLSVTLPTSNFHPAATRHNFEDVGGKQAGPPQCEALGGLPTSKTWPPFKKGHRIARAQRRNFPARRLQRDFNRFYARFMARRQKILFTQALARLR